MTNIAKIKRNNGFSLVELSIVIVIVGILLAASLRLGGAQMESSNIKETQRKLDSIEKAIQLYFNTQGALPCPADGSVPSTDALYGVGTQTAALSGTFSNATCGGVTLIGSDSYVLGTVPTRRLNLPDSIGIDAWGNKISYSVSKHCIDPDNWNTGNSYKCRHSSAATDDGGEMDIRNASGHILSVGTGAAFVLVSHGKNGIGSWPKNGGTRRTAGCPAAATSELDNANLSAACAASNDGQYRDDFINDGANAGALYFDDIVRWRTARQIFYDFEN